MFSTSSQLKYWTFRGETELAELRKEANQRFRQEHGSDMMVEKQAKYFLTAAEEKLLIRHFEFILREFCVRFLPPMPKYVLGTALSYFKRFYVHNSVMDYHPRDIMLTSVYLASKVEEFNVNISQFVGNLKGDREKFASIILGFELLLMDKLHYHLTVHNPFRPLEGFLIDLKTKFKGVDDVEKLRKGAEEFLDKSLSTDACLLFSPSQLALAAVLSSGSKEGMNLESYATDVLLAGAKEDEQRKTIYQIKRIRYIVKNQEPMLRDQIGPIQKKLEQCRNQENNPESEIYKRKLEEMFEEEEEIQSMKRARMEEAQKKEEQLLLGK
ncbi:hypothetical protein ACJMK2_025371 [Sinanodonta woodiana]|uniref:Cyclin-H n=1 Tax=Sinanodonta woodiana TaxID=1069815 RepID=A0ABD3XIN9_SINWO